MEKVIYRAPSSQAQTNKWCYTASQCSLCVRLKCKKLEESILNIEQPRISTGMTILECIHQSISIVLENSRQKNNTELWDFITKRENAKVKIKPQHIHMVDHFLIDILSKESLGTQQDF